MVKSLRTWGLETSVSSCHSHPSTRVPGHRCPRDKPYSWFKWWLDSRWQWGFLASSSGLWVNSFDLRKKACFPFLPLYTRTLAFWIFLLYSKGENPFLEGSSASKKLSWIPRTELVSWRSIQLETSVPSPFDPSSHIDEMSKTPCYMGSEL